MIFYSSTHLESKDETIVNTGIMYNTQKRFIYGMKLILGI